jgi:hypothetical protein
MWLKAIANPALVGLAVTFSKGRRSVKCRSRSVHDAATLQPGIFCAALESAYVFERPGGRPVFLRLATV